MKYIFIIIAIVVIIGGLFYSFNKNETKLKNLNINVDQAVDQNTANGLYVDYEESLLAKAKERKVVLFFHAGWCPSCKILDRNLKNSLLDFPKDLIILKLDYDKATELKKKYNIITQHTLVQVDFRGNEIIKWVGSNNLADILRHLKY